MVRGSRRPSSRSRMAGVGRLRSAAVLMSVPAVMMAISSGTLTRAANRVRMRSLPTRSTSMPEESTPNVATNCSKESMPRAVRLAGSTNRCQLYISATILLANGVAVAISPTRPPRSRRYSTFMCRSAARCDPVMARSFSAVTSIRFLNRCASSMTR